MKKIPTLFQRNPNNRRYVTDVVTPGCEWVLAGEGVPTRKYDGTCVMLDSDGRWWARREVKPGKAAPENYVPISTDETTGKTMGWEPIEQSPFARFWREATDGLLPFYSPGTHELIGPKINGNPEDAHAHYLINHEHSTVINPGEVNVSTWQAAIQSAREHGWEGIVWHHPDGRMAKLKVRDFQ